MQCRPRVCVEGAQCLMLRQCVQEAMRRRTALTICCVLYAAMPLLVPMLVVYFFPPTTLTLRRGLACATLGVVHFLLICFFYYIYVLRSEYKLTAAGREAVKEAKRQWEAFVRSPPIPTEALSLRQRCSLSLLVLSLLRHKHICCSHA